MLMKYNGIKAPYMIYAGQILKIPGKTVPIEPPKPQERKVQVITPRGLNVRAKATFLSKRLKTLSTGRIVTITDVQSGWGYIPQEQGWISLKYTKDLR